MNTARLVDSGRGLWRLACCVNQAWCSYGWEEQYCLCDCYIQLDLGGLIGFFNWMTLKAENLNMLLFFSFEFDKSI